MPDGMGRFTDDTQMILFTAEALILHAKTGEPLLIALHKAYLRWLATQKFPSRIPPDGKRLANPPLRVGTNQAKADFFQFHGKSSWSRLLGQVGNFSSTSQRYAKGSTPLSLQVSMML